MHVRTVIKNHMRLHTLFKQTRITHVIITVTWVTCKKSHVPYVRTLQYIVRGEIISDV